MSCLSCQRDIIKEVIRQSKLQKRTWFHLGKSASRMKNAQVKQKNVPFNTTARAKGFEINRASVLAFRTIGRGNAAASKAFSFLGLKPINDRYWTDHTTRIDEEDNKALQKELDEGAFQVKII